MADPPRRAAPTLRIYCPRTGPPGGHFLAVFWPLFAFFLIENSAARSDFLWNNAPGAAHILVNFQFAACRFDRVNWHFLSLAEPCLCNVQGVNTNNKPARRAAGAARFFWSPAGLPKFSITPCPSCSPRNWGLFGLLYAATFLANAR